jgi:signal peptidase II
MKNQINKYIILATTIFIIDRATKLAALVWCADSAYTVNSFLSFEVVFNRGISWGMFHSQNDALFFIVSVIIALITVALCWHAYQRYMQGNFIFAEVCIIAGSCCNLIDRVFYGGVIDFILLSYGNLSWPVFNIADAVIVLGVGLFILQYDPSIHSTPPKAS